MIFKTCFVFLAFGVAQVKNTLLLNISPNISFEYYLLVSFVQIIYCAPTEQAYLQYSDSETNDNVPVALKNEKSQTEVVTQPQADGSEDTQGSDNQPETEGVAPTKIETELQPEETDATEQNTQEKHQQQSIATSQVNGSSHATSDENEMLASSDEQNGSAVSKQQEESQAPAVDTINQEKVQQIVENLSNDAADDGNRITSQGQDPNSTPVVSNDVNQGQASSDTEKQDEEVKLNSSVPIGGQNPSSIPIQYQTPNPESRLVPNAAGEQNTWTGLGQNAAMLPRYEQIYLGPSSNSQFQYPSNIPTQYQYQVPFPMNYGNPLIPPGPSGMIDPQMFQNTPPFGYPPYLLPQMWTQPQPFLGMSNIPGIPSPIPTNGFQYLTGVNNSNGILNSQSSTFGQQVPLAPPTAKIDLIGDIIKDLNANNIPAAISTLHQYINTKIQSVRLILPTKIDAALENCKNRVLVSNISADKKTSLINALDNSASETRNTIDRLITDSANELTAYGNVAWTHLRSDEILTQVPNLQNTIDGKVIEREFLIDAAEAEGAKKLYMQIKDGINDHSSLEQAS